MDLTVVDVAAKVRCEWGLWVADCPQPWCVGADHYGPGPQTGRIGGLTPERFTCPRCGTRVDASWPHNLDEIRHVLEQRPMFETRNWRPGEEVKDLITENLIHGIGVKELATRSIQINSDRYADRTMLAGQTLRAIGG